MQWKTGCGNPGPQHTSEHSPGLSLWSPGLQPGEERRGAVGGTGTGDAVRVRASFQKYRSILSGLFATCLESLHPFSGDLNCIYTDQLTRDLPWNPSSLTYQGSTEHPCTGSPHSTLHSPNQELCSTPQHLGSLLLYNQRPAGSTVTLCLPQATSCTAEALHRVCRNYSQLKPWIHTFGFLRL